jgi:hypothetical protein
VQNNEFSFVVVFFKSESTSQCRREFRQNFPVVTLPSSSAIHKIVKKFKSSGSVLNKKNKTKTSYFDRGKTS